MVPTWARHAWATFATSASRTVEGVAVQVAYAAGAPYADWVANFGRFDDLPGADGPEPAPGLGGGSGCEGSTGEPDADTLGPRGVGVRPAGRVGVTMTPVSRSP